MEDKLYIIDFGSQYTQLIARKIRELNVYCEIHPFNELPVIDTSVKGVILSGSPHSVLDTNSPTIEVFEYIVNLPVLGICYGAQLIANLEGGVVEASKNREYGRARLSAQSDKTPLFDGVSEHSQVWMSHGDTILELPGSYEIVASTESVKVAAFHKVNSNIFGIQFHPEVYHSEEGIKLLGNFAKKICGIQANWTPAHYIDEQVSLLKDKLGNDKVVMGLSGGVDSSVAAAIIDKAIGNRLHCIFVDNGLLRKNEYEEVLESYRHLGLNVKGVGARQRFWNALNGISDPEQKRKAIGKTFIDVFDEAAHEIQDVNWLGQGTIYPDVIESKSVKGPSATIKSHHNVGGLPDTMMLKVVEPLNSLFKDEVRRVGKELNLPSAILSRHPFPGPGLAIRILGDITPEKVELLQEADHIFIKALRNEGLYDQVWQAGAVLLPVQSVGVMGDERTYEQVVALRAVGSTDGMTADWIHLPYDFLAKVSNDIINKIKGINRVVYDISSKPPATIEWE